MRATEQRKRDAIAKLEGDMDVWVATAVDHENAHLVPLSLCWHNEGVVVATESWRRWRLGLHSAAAPDGPGLARGR